jgi:hypothetical protein
MRDIYVRHRPRCRFAQADYEDKKGRPPRSIFGCGCPIYARIEIRDPVTRDTLFQHNGNFNEATTDASARRLISRIHQRLDQKLFGRKFFKRPESARTFFVAVPEVASSLHYHFLFRVPAEKHDLFLAYAPAIIKNVAKASSCQIDAVRSQADKDRIASYITKDAYMKHSIENYIVSSEFNRQRATVNPADSPVSELASSIR